MGHAARARDLVVSPTGLPSVVSRKRGWTAGSEACLGKRGNAIPSRSPPLGSFLPLGSLLNLHDPRFPLVCLRKGCLFSAIQVTKLLLPAGGAVAQNLRGTLFPASAARELVSGWPPWPRKALFARAPASALGVGALRPKPSMPAPARRAAVQNCPAGGRRGSQFRIPKECRLVPFPLPSGHERTNM